VSVIAWEYELVEKPFCQQLQAMGWEWIEGDPDLMLPSGPTGSLAHPFKDHAWLSSFAPLIGVASVICGSGASYSGA
jgi:hypothetical protein